MAQLGDILAGAAGAPVNRPAINAYIANGQAINGLRSAQTEEALINAQKAREEQDAAGQLEEALGKIMPPSQARAAALMMQSHFGNSKDAMDALLANQLLGNRATLGDPAQLGTPAQTAAQQGIQGKVAEPVAVPPNYTVLPGQPNPTVHVSPLGAALADQRNASANASNAKAAAAAAPMGMNQSDIDVFGDRLYETGQMPALGMGASPLRQSILASAAARARGERQPVPAGQGTGGTAAGNMNANAAYAAANKNAMSALQRQAGLVGAYEQTAGSNMDLAAGYIGKLDSTGSPLLDRALRQFDAGVAGDPDTQAAVLALNTARSEYERVVSGASGAQGITDQARTEGQKMFPNGITSQQLPSVIAAAKADMANRVAGFTNQLKHTKDLIANGGDAAATAPMVTTPPAPNATPAAAPAAKPQLPSYATEAAARAAGHQSGERVNIGGQDGTLN